jgi:hypothetical protein
MEDAQLQTVWQQRQMHHRCDPLSRPLAMLMKYTLGKRVKQIGQVSRVWREMIPDELLSHTALESLHRGVLTVLVDTAAHRFQLETLLRGGMERQIRRRCTSPLRKIRLVPGQFYQLDAQQRPRVDLTG